MRTMRSAILPILVALLAGVPVARAGWDGTIKLGGIVVEDEGDKSAVQETYNIYDGFSINRLRLAGSPNDSNYFLLDLREINLDSRQGDLLWRRPGLLRLKASLVQSRQVFDPDRTVTSSRKNWNADLRITPTRSLGVTGFYGHTTRDGNRLPYPAGTVSELGTGYDYALSRGGVGVSLEKDRRGLALDYRISDFADDRNPAADRTGHVVSARLHTPGFAFDEITHMVRAAYGVSKLANSELDYTFGRFQYTGILRPVKVFELKYDFEAQRVDNESTALKTDRFQNILDATYYHSLGSAFLGYGYEINDDDRTLTNYHTWRAGISLRASDVSARVKYAGRVKTDEADVTLLQDAEASRLRADLEITPTDDFALGVGFNARKREFPDIQVESEGSSLRPYLSWSYPEWGRLSGTYTFTDDSYTDRAGGYDVESHVVTGRVDFERIRDLRLAAGLTYLKMDEDLDIEKSVIFLEGAYRVLDRLEFEVKYNVYNYDDFVILDRYYTGNVVWFNVAYDLHIE